MTASPWWNGDMAVLFVIVLILVIGAAVMAASGREIKAVSASTSASDSLIGSMPFLRQLP